MFWKIAISAINVILSHTRTLERSDNIGFEKIQNQIYICSSVRTACQFFGGYPLNLSPTLVLFRDSSYAWPTCFDHVESCSKHVSLFAWHFSRERRATRSGRREKETKKKMKTDTGRRENYSSPTLTCPRLMNPCFRATLSACPSRSPPDTRTANWFV